MLIGGKSRSTVRTVGGYAFWLATWQQGPVQGAAAGGSLRAVAETGETFGSTRKVTLPR